VKFQRLYYQNKKVKHNHTVGFYSIQKEHELDLMGRLRGGGKRGRGGAGANKVSREDKIEEKSSELNLILLQLDQYKNVPVVADTLSSITLFNSGMSTTIIKDAINSVLSMDQLRSIHSGFTTHREDTRMFQLTKHIFMRDVNATNHAKKAMELNTKAIEAAITLGFLPQLFIEMDYWIGVPTLWTS